MKLTFAAAAAIAMIASVPAHAVSVMSAGQTPAQDCSSAAAGASLSDRAIASGIAACNVALKGDLSHQAIAATLVNRGILRSAAGNTNAAVADFNAAIARDNGLAAAYMNRGSAMLRAERFNEARADFDQAINLGASNLHVAYFNRGEAQEASGNLVAAYHDYRKAQELAPDFKPASLELARFQVNDRRVATIR